MGGERKKKVIKNCVQWILAGISGLLIVNFCLFAYYKPAAWIDRTNASTDAIWNPGAVIVHGTEGYGIHTVDSKGYLNSAIPSGGGYYLCVGASYTQAKEVPSNKSFCSLLNVALGGNEEDIRAYNVSQDGFYFPSIVKHFACICEEFPEADTIIIEIGSTQWDTDELTDALYQTEYDPSQNGENIAESQSKITIAKNTIKENLPFLSLAKKKIDGILGDDEDEVEDEVEDYQEVYENALNECLNLIRNEFTGNIIILYHPSVSIEADGTMSINTAETDAIFAQVCADNGIEFVNMTDSFHVAYDEDYSVPYGFYNTSIGSGHLNATGHRLIAEKLYEVLRGGDAE